MKREYVKVEILWDLESRRHRFAKENRKLAKMFFRKRVHIKM